MQTFLRGFGEMVKEVLDHRGMTPEELAHAIGVADWVVAGLLNGTYIPALSVVASVAHALDCTPDITFDPFENKA